MGKEVYVNTNQSLQQAVDKLAGEGGGTVIVGSGKHVLRNALRLRSNVSITGEPGAVLERLPSISTPITNYLGYGHYELTLENAEGFEVGDGVYVQDDDSHGFYDTVATITQKEGNTVFIDRFFNHDYSALRNGMATRVFSVVEGEGIENASIENIVLDGNPAETFTVDACRAEGVFFLRCRNVRIKNVEVRNFKGDAVGFQQCVDVWVIGCNIHDNTGNGLHPGSGSVRYIIKNNKVYDNGGCGLFYCLRTTHSICSGNHFENNGMQGISVGERDSNHIITGNKVLSNQQQGILFRIPNRESGNRVLVESNVVGSNCKVEGEYEIEVSDELEDIHIYDNTIVAVRAKPIYVGNSGPAVRVYGNTISGQPQSSAHISGSKTRVVAAKGELPPLGPDALPKNGARHLNIPELWPWKDI